jgi:hypothetical protein
VLRALGGEDGIGGGLGGFGGRRHGRRTLRAAQIRLNRVCRAGTVDV